MSEPERARIARPPLRDLAQLAVAVVGVSFSGPIIAATGAPVLAIAAWRCLLAAGLTIPFVRVQRGFSRRIITTSAVSGLALAAHFAVWMGSLRLTSVASAVTLGATQPVWSAMLAHRAGHRMPRLAWFGIGLCVSGVVLISGFDLSVSSRALLGDLLALVGAVLAAAYFALGERARQVLPTATYTSIAYSVAGLSLLVVTLGTGRAMTGYANADWWRIIALTLTAQLLGHTVMSRVLATTSATWTSLAVLLEMPGATLIAALWLGQRPTYWLIPSLLLLGVGLVLVVRAGDRPSPVLA